MQKKITRCLNTANMVLQALNFAYTTESETVNDVLKELKMLIIDKFNEIDCIDPDNFEFLTNMQALQNYIGAYTVIKEGILVKVIKKDTPVNELYSELADASINELEDLYNIIKELMQHLENVD